MCRRSVCFDGGNCSTCSVSPALKRRASSRSDHQHDHWSNHTHHQCMTMFSNSWDLIRVSVLFRMIPISLMLMFLIAGIVYESEPKVKPECRRWNSILFSSVLYDHWLFLLPSCLIGIDRLCFIVLLRNNEGFWS